MTAALLWAGPKGILSHWSAASLHGLCPLETRVPHVWAPNGRYCRGINVRRLFPDDQPRSRVVRGLRVTRVERTLLDMCAIASPQEVGEMMDAALRQRLTSIDKLRLEPGRASDTQKRGVARYRALVCERDADNAKVRSELEARMLRILRSLPQPSVADHRVDDGKERYYLDFAFPAYRLGIECQSVRWHLGTDMLKRDAARHRRLTFQGWTILYFCWDDVVFAPERVRSEIQQALGACLV